MHHVVPRIHGGTKVVALCNTCHSKVHGLKSYDISKLTKIGMEKARKIGKQIGGPPHKKTPLILDLHEHDFNYYDIAKLLGMHRSVIRRIILRNKR